MYGTEFEPGKPGRDDPASLQYAGASLNKERRQAGTPATLEENLEKTLNAGDSTGRSSKQQAYPVRWLTRRYGLSSNYAAIVATELCWGGA